MSTKSVQKIGLDLYTSQKFGVNLFIQKSEFISITEFSELKNPQINFLGVKP